MSAVGMVAERDERPALVRFERVAVEDKAAGLKAGHYVGRDVDFALITPPYSKDVFKTKIPQWFSNMEQDVANGRLPEKWRDDYKQAYERWKNGQEIPLNGVPIRGWGVISPAQQETLTRMNILTVEDLAHVNDEGIRRIGMGAMELKNKASAWLSQLTDKGPLTQEIASLKAENVVLKASIESLEKRLEILLRQDHREPNEAVESLDISVSDIMEEDVSRETIQDDHAEAFRIKFGRKPHPHMSKEKLLQALAE